AQFLLQNLFWGAGCTSNRTKVSSPFASSEFKRRTKRIRHSKTDDMLRREGQPFDGPGESMARRRYQKGRVFQRGKANPVWVGRWREDVIGADGVTRRKERSAILGSKSAIPTKRLAIRRLETLLSRINAPDYRPVRIATLA